MTRELFDEDYVDNGDNPHQSGPGGSQPNKTLGQGKSSKPSRVSVQRQIDPIEKMPPPRRKYSVASTTGDSHAKPTLPAIRQSRERDVGPTKLIHSKNPVQQLKNTLDSKISIHEQSRRQMRKFT